MVTEFGKCHLEGPWYVKNFWIQKVRVELAGPENGCMGECCVL